MNAPSLRRVSILLLAAAGIAPAQSITIAGAAIKLIQQGAGAIRQSLTTDRGNFVIGSPPPGAYDLFVVDTNTSEAQTS